VTTGFFTAGFVRRVVCAPMRVVRKKSAMVATVIDFMKLIRNYGRSPKLSNHSRRLGCWMRQAKEKFEEGRAFDRLNSIQFRVFSVFRGLF
jgi:hypothetical protein